MKLRENKICIILSKTLIVENPYLNHYEFNLHCCTKSCLIFDKKDNWFISLFVSRIKFIKSGKILQQGHLI